MTIVIAIIVLALACVVLLVISAPLRAARSGAADAPTREGMLASAERHELEAAREAVYREIRDAELDYRTGKLTRADYESIDGELRRRALTILDRLGEEEPMEAEAMPRDA